MDVIGEVVKKTGKSRAEVEKAAKELWDGRTPQQERAKRGGSDPDRIDNKLVDELTRKCGS